MKGFTANTRVQVPAAMQLCRLGYEYLDDITSEDFDASTNILTGIFTKAFLRLNPGRADADAKAELQKLIVAAANDDLGREFYREITRTSGIKLIDFENPDQNLWHCTTEFTCENPESHDNFRPDITCFVNGLPLAFVDVKIEHIDISAAEFQNRIADFSSTLAEMSKEGAALDKAIAANLKKLELVK